MRVLSFNVYSFNELSEEAQKKAWEKHVNHLEYVWVDEGIDSLNKFAGALDKYSNKSVNPGSQQEKEKERTIATPSSIGGGNIQKLTDNFTALYPQTFSPFTVAGVQGEKGVLGSIFGPVAAAATSLIPGVGPILAPIAGAAVSSLG